MPCEVIWLDQARDDLSAILEFIAKESPKAALNYVAEIEGQCLQLADFPESGRRYNETYRCLVFRNHLIFYRHDSDANRVTIVTVLDGRRDLERLLS
jgi:toxin ParE1/3/4